MKSEERALVAAAAASLQIRDIMLNACSFRRPVAPPADPESVDVAQLTKRAVHYVLGEAPIESAEHGRLLQVIVGLGIRITHKDKLETIYFEIEADFLAEYTVHSEISEDAIKVFAQFNSVHNVWPFWRQHVFDTVSRGRLPHLDIPLFGGQQEQSST